LIKIKIKQVLLSFLFINLIIIVFALPLFAQDNFANDFNLLFPDAEFIKTVEGPPFLTNGEVTVGTVIGFVYKIKAKILIKNSSSTNKTFKIITITPDGIEHSFKFNSEKQSLEIDKLYNFSYEVTTKYKGTARIITQSEENSVFLK
jgi:hypothetical protein